VEAIRSLIHPYLLRGLVLAPLALGNHIDHQAVRCAAMSLPAAERLGFYEDLPYATWISGQRLSERVGEIQEATGVALESRVVHRHDALQSKLRIVSRYASQITGAEAETIAAYSSRYGGGERIWIPKESQLWRFLIQ